MSDENEQLQAIKAEDQTHLKEIVEWERVQEGQRFPKELPPPFGTGKQ